MNTSPKAPQDLSSSELGLILSHRQLAKIMAPCAGELRRGCWFPGMQAVRNFEAFGLASATVKGRRAWEGRRSSSAAAEFARPGPSADSRRIKALSLKQRNMSRIVIQPLFAASFDYMLCSTRFCKGSEALERLVINAIDMCAECERESLPRSSPHGRPQSIDRVLCLSCGWFQTKPEVSLKSIERSSDLFSDETFVIAALALAGLFVSSLAGR